MERVVHKLLSYINSHIYDIHAVVVSLIVSTIMFFISKKIGKKYFGRSRLIITGITVILSVIVFFMVSLISPFITFSLSSAIMSSVFVLFEYALVKQLCIK